MVLKRTLLGVVFVLMLAAAASAASKTAAAPAANIGLVDIMLVTNSHPGLGNVRQQLATVARQKEAEAKAAADKETDNAKKAQAIQAKRMEVVQEEQKLMEPIIRDCENAVRVVAKNKNITLVLNATMVLYGGTDITQDVIQQLAKKK